MHIAHTQPPKRLKNSQIMPSTVILDVGGVSFRVTKATLSCVDCFFSRIISDAWSEGVDNERERNADESAFLSKSLSKGFEKL